MEYKYKYEMPSVTGDVILKRGNNVLLVKRLNEPFKDMWALPGGFLDMNETTEKCAARELFEETGMVANNLTFFMVADKVDRDPRGRVVGIVYCGDADPKAAPVASDDAKEVKFFNLNDLPELAFDHAEILKKFNSEYQRRMI
jgi:8-oxo-dGTP diphosphatase